MPIQTTTPPTVMVNLAEHPLDDAVYEVFYFAAQRQIEEAGKLLGSERRAEHPLDFTKSFKPEEELFFYGVSCFSAALDVEPYQDQEGWEKEMLDVLRQLATSHSPALRLWAASAVSVLSRVHDEVESPE